MSWIGFGVCCLMLLVCVWALIYFKPFSVSVAVSSVAFVLNGFVFWRRARG